MFDSSDYSSLLDMTGKVAIVTGASRGIGRSIAQGFAAAGAAVVVSSRKHDACVEAVAEIVDAGGVATPVAAHMGRLDDVAALVQATVDAHGGVDVVVNNAANPLMLGVGNLTDEAWDKAIGTNLKGPVFLVQEALPYLRDGGGSVINVLSNAAFLYSGGHLLYAVAKAGMAAATRSMAPDLMGSGVRVNNLVPGTVDTAMVQAMPEQFRESAAKASLIGRAAHPDELIGMALVLASDAGSFMTGHTYFVDGGQSYTQ